MKHKKLGTHITRARGIFIVALTLICQSTASAADGNEPAGSRSVALPMWQPLPGTLCTEASGIMTVSSRGTFWNGAIAYPEVGCNYRFDADGRLRDGGSGYGLAVRASVTDGQTPHGQGIQYDQGMRGLRDVLLPSESESGIIKPTTIDSKWHHITVAVVGSRYESSVDGQVVFSGSTPTSCGNGILIRVWRSTADFRNISVTPITTLPGPEEFAVTDFQVAGENEIEPVGVKKSVALKMH